MESSPSNGQSSLSGNVLFYKNPQPLSADQHGGLGVKQIEAPFSFLKTAHAVPLTVGEFGQAANSYPVIFVGADKAPVAVMGVRQGENLFVTNEGLVEPDYYVPAFARRYPFVFANDSNSDRLLLCVDRDADMVSNRPDTPFFENGEPTDFTNNAIEFCKEFERQRQATDEFVKLLDSHNLFVQKEINFQPRDAAGNPSGDPQKIADYWGVDEQPLKEVSQELYLELRDRGAIGPLFAHIISLTNWNRVMQRAVVRQAAEQAVGGTA